ncbi:ELWxxDGT repeat protein [Bdellovibrio svalbardensis]|uniref:Hyalin n=1 Tax=Bdellovibrio svalbardensis TaxID=2972972 RepID=A0ABT6DMF1_9BACT|nr:ELWxxDGT repeat protein [Bdellovibrio svalbardensis]MDG0816991.1 hypothetical protein [Bdellovibrio svalbardensis]
MKKCIYTGATGLTVLISMLMGCSNTVKNLVVASTEPETSIFNPEGTLEFFKEINPGSSAADPASFAMLGSNKFLFYANDGTNGVELWASDGTAAGTALVKDIFTGPSSSYPAGYTILQGVSPATAVFNATSATSDSSLWKTDGTTSGTVQIKNIRTGATDGLMNFFSTANGKVLFQANDGSTGAEPWVTDGTLAGTTQLADINSGALDSTPFGHRSIGNNEYMFLGNTGSPAIRQVFKTDGVTVSDVRSDFTKSCTILGVPAFGSLGSGKKVFAQCDDANGNELWITDGTYVGTQLLKDINPGTSGSTPQGFQALPDGRVIFFAITPSTGSELWVTDGTESGTTLLKDILPGTGSGGGNGFTDLKDGRFIFHAADATGNYEPWITDGTLAGTRKVKEINPGTAASSAGGGFALLKPGVVVFWANDGVHGNEPWISDGTEQGTKLLLDTIAGASTAVWNTGSPPFVFSSTKIFFNGCEGTVASNPPHCKELYSINVKY